MECTINRPLCRLCLCYDVLFVDIFKHDESQKYNLITVMLELLELKVSEDDGYPKALCSDCFKTIIDFKKFKEECHQAKITYDENIRPKEIHDVNRRSQELDNEIEETSDIRPKLEFHIDKYDMWGNLITEESSEITEDHVKEEESMSPEVVSTEIEMNHESNTVERSSENIKQLKCSECSKEFSRKCDYTRHSRVHKEINPSQQESSEIIVEHVIEEECLSSGVLSTEIEVNNESRTVEQSTENIKQLKCLECSKEFSRKCDYTRHSRVHKSVTSSSSEQDLDSRCTRSTDVKQKEVDRVTPNINLLQDERERTSDMESNNSCESNGMTSVEFVQAITSSKSDKSDEDEFELFRPEDSPLESGWMLRMEERHSSDEEEELEDEDVGWKLRNSDVKKRDGIISYYACHHCCEIFSDIRSLNMHLPLHERDVDIEGKESSSTSAEVNKTADGNIGKISHSCGVCGRIFKGDSNLKVHMMTHSGDKPHECDICHKRFNRKCNRDQHVVRIHENYRCSYCNKPFSVKDKLSEHVQECRVKRVFRCNSCDKCFDSILSRNEHLSMHTTEEVFKCRYCDKCFGRRDYLSRHERIHTKECLFSCGVCGKSFSDRSNFNTHQRMHLNDKPYKCDYCDKCYVHNSHLRLHERKHTKERPFRCSLCDKCFSYKSLVKKHERIHRKVKEFACRFCGKYFSLREYLKQHEKIHLKILPF